MKVFPETRMNADKSCSYSYTNKRYICLGRPPFELTPRKCEKRGSHFGLPSHLHCTDLWMSSQLSGQSVVLPPSRRGFEPRFLHRVSHFLLIKISSGFSPYWSSFF